MSFEPDALLTDVRWLERLARSLVADEHAAHDLAQDVWVAATDHPHAIRGDRRAWMTGTLQNLVARLVRSRARRQRRELATRRPEHAPSTAEVTARAELHGRLLAHVNALPEHYRVPLLLRYYDDVPPRAIAAQLGVPVRTVQTRLSRGLAQLRERLDAEHARGRAGWVAALLLPTTPAAWPWPRAVAALTVVGVATAAIVGWGTSPNPTAPPLPVATAALAAASAAPALARESASAPTVADASPALRGIVVDWQSRPVAGASVTLAEHRGIAWPDASSETLELVAGPTTELPTPTDRAGEFVAAAATTPFELRAKAPGMVTTLVAIWRPDSAPSPRVVMAPARRLQGCCVDDDGVPIANADVCVSLLENFDASTQRGTTGMHALHWQCCTDANGRFALAAVPAVDEAQVVVTAAEHDPLTLSLAAATDTLTLHRWPAATVGRLVDGRGAPLVGAVVATAAHVTTTRADGSFALPDAPGTPWFAAAQGLAPFAAPAARASSTTTLDIPAAAFVGTVHFADGRAMAGAEISLDDPTLVGPATAPCVLEAVAGGGSRTLHRALAAANGRFHLGGLADRAYRLRIVDPTTAAWFITEPLAPGATTIVAPPDLVDARRTFHLQTADGQPLVGAHVAVQTASYVLPLANGVQRDVLFAAGASATSGERGDLTLGEVPRQGAHLRVAHPAVGITTLELTANTPTTLVFERIGELVVCAANACDDQWIELVDATGAILSAQCRAGLGLRRAVRWPLQRGNSPVLEVPANVVQVRIGSPRGTTLLPVTVRPGGRVRVDG